MITARAAAAEAAPPATPPASVEPAGPPAAPGGAAVASADSPSAGAKSTKVASTDAAGAGANATAEPAPNEAKRAARRGTPDLMEEMIVTATRRETKLEKTAVAVTALSEEVLQRQQLVDLKSVTDMVPNLQIGAHSDSAAVDVAMRGIVSTNRTELGDPAVAFHVDGFYSPRPQGATALLYDVERIEVLRGPQGTLFGRNSTAGVINVVTRKPDLEAASVYADSTAGNYSLGRFQGHLNAPLAKGLALRGAFFLDRRDGYIDFQRGSKVEPGAAKYDNSNKSSFRLSGLWEPDPSVTAFVVGEYYSDQGAGVVPVRISPLDGTKLRSALIDSPGMLDMRNASLHGRADWRPASFVEVSYLGAWAQMTRKNVSDNDVGFNAVQNFQQEHRTHDSKFISQSHEIQVKSVDLAKLDLIAGAFYYREHNRIRFDIDINDDPDGDGIPNTDWAMSFIQPDRVLKSYAGYAQGTFHALDTLRLTAGARYTSDEKSDVGGRNLVCPAFGATRDNGGFNLRYLTGIPYAQNMFNNYPYPADTCGSFPGNNGNDADVTWTKLTWTGRVEWDALDRLLVYASASTGFQSGVIQDGGSHANPETVLTFEIGGKTTLLDDRLVLNLAGFQSNYNDILRSTAERQADGSQQLVTRNAAKALIRGVEAEASYSPTRAARVQLMASWLDAKYEKFVTIDNVLYATGDALSPQQDLKGNYLTFSPRFSASVAAEYRFEVGEGRSLVPRVQSHLQSEMYLGDFNRTAERQDAYMRTDLSLRLMTSSGWLAEVFVLNVEDAAVKSNVEYKGGTPGAGGIPGTPGTAYAYYDPPRTYGVRLAYGWTQ